jgi:signal transduction histidine kinase
MIGQTASTDSDTTLAGLRAQIDDLNARTWDLLRENPDQAEPLIAEASTLLEQCSAAGESYEEGLADTLRNKSWFHLQRGEYESAFQQVMAALSTLNSTQPRRRVFLLRVLGNIHFDLDNYTEALETEMEALRLCEQYGSDTDKASILNLIGLIHMRMGEYRDARTYMRRAYSLYENADNTSGMADVLGKLCNLYCYQGAHEAALTAGRKSLALYREAGSYQRGEAEVLISLGEVYREIEAYQQSLHYLDMCLVLSRQMGNRYNEAHSLIQMGQTKTAQGDYPAALGHLEAAMAIVEDSGTQYLRYECHRAFSEAYKGTGDFHQSLQHYEHYHTTRDQVLSAQAAARLKTLSVMHKLEAAQKETESYQLRSVELTRQIELKEELIAELDSFARTVAHDLKTPLSLITGYSELLMTDIVAMNRPDLVRRLELILNAAFKTNRIIEELLILSGVRKQRIDLRPLNMGHIVHEVELRINHILTDANPVEIIKPAAWPVALGHAPWVEEVWANYISNAIKYGGDPPRLKLGATVQDDGFICFWVRDNGDGINPEVQHQLFTAFERLGQTKVTGHGLGLSIVKRIVEKLDGEVGIESSPGEGSVFSFTLRAAPPDSLLD